jgi:CysZ protein
MVHTIGKIGLLKGATYPFKVIALFWRSPKLLQYLILPILINSILGIVFYAGLTIFGWEKMGDLITSFSAWLNSISGNLPNWLSFLTFIAIGLAFILRVILIILLFMIMGFVFLQLGVIIGAPWYGKLSEALEQNYTGNLEIIEVGIIKDISRAILFEIKKLFLMIGVSIPLFLTNFIPGVGTVFSTVGGFILTGTIICLDFFDSPLERRRLKFRSKLGFIFRALPASATFSSVCLILISIPFLNLITIPLCVASGTLFFCELTQKTSIVNQQNNPSTP